MIDKRARLFCKSVIVNMKMEFTAKCLSCKRAGFVVLFMIDFLTQCVQWLKEGLSLRVKSETKMTLADGYRYVSVLLLALYGV